MNVIGVTTGKIRLESVLPGYRHRVIVNGEIIINGVLTTGDPGFRVFLKPRKGCVEFSETQNERTGY